MSDYRIHEVAQYWTGKLYEAVNCLRMIVSHPCSTQLEAIAMKQLAINFLKSNGYMKPSELEPGRNYANFGAEMSEKYLDPPEPVWWAECEICGATRDCGDMQEVEDDVWVCDLKGTDCLDEWNKQKPEEE